MGRAIGAVLATLLVVSLATSQQRYASVFGGGAHDGTSTANAWTLAEAGASAVAGDTVNIRAGVYTDALAPANHGTFASPIVWRKYQQDAGVCSLYVADVPLQITTSFIIVRDDIAFRPVPATGLPPVEISGSIGNNAVIGCRIYGGSYENGIHDGTYYTVGIHDSPYNLILDNWIDRGDVVSDNDDYRGNAVEIFGSASKYNIVEGNRISRVSHFAINIGYGPTYNIIRNNEIWNIHGGLELQNGTQHNMLDGNWVRSPDMVCSNRNGAGVELYGRYNIMRYNRIDHDTSCAVTAFMTDRNTEVIVNCDATGDAWGDPCSPLLTDRDGRYYHNSFTSVTTFPNGGSTQWKFVVGELDAGLDNEFGHHVWTGNIFAQSTDTTLFYYQNAAGPDADPTDTARGNLWWRGSPGRNVITALTTNNSGVYTLASAKSTFGSWIETSNIEAPPGWVDSTSRGKLRSPELSGTSAARDRSVALAIVMANASGTVVTVSDALPFHFNWGGSPYDKGDTLYIKHAGSFVKAELDSADYSNNRLIFSASVSVSLGDSVFVGATYNTLTDTYTNRLSGERPDIGPYEYQVLPTPPTGIDTTANVAPENASTQAQPITFKWRTVAGAEGYWLTASYDQWAHDHVSVVVTDTEYVFSGFPADVEVIWNVAVLAGGEMSAWTSISSFRTQAEISYPNSLTIDWNATSTSNTLSDNTVISEANQRNLFHVVALHNDAGAVVLWPAEIEWLGRTTPPQPSALSTSVYLLIRDGSRVYGFDMPHGSGTSGGVTAQWVLSQLAAYIKKDAYNTGSLRLSGNQTYPKITLTEESAPDSVIIDSDGGTLRFWDAETGWKTLAELAAGGSGGVADGQDADSIQGKPVNASRPAGPATVTYVPSAGEYQHLSVAELGDTAGVDAGGSGELHKLTIIDGKVQWRNDSTGVTDHGQLTGLLDDDHTQYVLDADLPEREIGYVPTWGYDAAGENPGLYSNRWFEGNAYFLRWADGYLEQYGGMRDYTTQTYYMFEADSASKFMSRVYLNDYLQLPRGTGQENYVPKWSAAVNGPVWRPDSVGVGGAGVADGQNADSIQGLPISPYRPAGKLMVMRHPDSLGYIHAPTFGADTTGAAVLPSARSKFYYDASTATMKVGTAHGTLNASHSWTDSLSGATGTGEQSFATTYTIPANYITSGTLLRVTVLLKYVATATVPNTTLRLKIGGTNVSTSTAAALTAGTYYLGYQFYVRGRAVPGASVAVEVDPMTASSGTTGGSRWSGGGTNLATNGTLAVSFSAQWSATTAGNNMNLRQLIVEDITP